MTRPTLLALLMAGAAATSAPAQDNAQVPPVLTSPTLDNFSLPPGNPTPTPAPTASPTPTTAPPSVVPTVRPTPSSRARAAPRPAATSTPAAIAPPPPVSSPTVSSSTPVAPAVIVPPATTTAPAPEPASWPWWVGGGLLLVAAAAGIALWRRRAPGDRAAPETDEAAPAAVSTPSPPAAPLRTGASLDVPPGRSLVSTLRPHEIRTQGPDAVLAFDVVVTNHGTVPADAIRASVALTSAGPDIAAEIAAYHASAPAAGAAEPFALQPGESYVLGGEIVLPGAAMHVNEVADRAMIVPVAMVALRWRGGLSVRSAGDAFIVGTGDAAAAKLGPIWVDRAGARFARLDARRFVARG